MPLVYIDDDEEYPVYSYVPERPYAGAYGIEIDDETLARWDAVTTAYAEVQAEMAAAERQARLQQR